MAARICFAMVFSLGLFTQTACAERDASQAAVGAVAKPGQVALENAGFEQPGDATNIPGWNLFQHGGEASYLVAIDKKSPGKGRQSLRMTQIHEQFYGLLEQQLNASPDMVGKLVEVSALAKTSGVGDNGWVLWMYAYDAGDALLGDYESTPVVGTTKWKRITVVGKIPPNTHKLKFGAQMKDQGNHGIGWLDDVQMRIVPSEGPAKP